MDPIKSKDVGKVQIRFVERAVGGGERRDSGQLGQRTRGREREEQGRAEALGRQSREGRRGMQKVLESHVYSPIKQGIIMEIA